MVTSGRRESGVARLISVRDLLNRPQVWVILAAAGYAVAQLLLLHEDRFFEWDEAVYVSEVRPGTRPIGFAVHRARGIVWLIAPVTGLSPSIAALRIYLVALSSVGLAAAFLIWSRQIRWAAPIAAGLFAVNWSTVLYGSEVSPNLFVACVAIAAVGTAVWCGREPSTWLLIMLAALIGVATIFRPLDAFLLAIAAAATAVIIERRVRRPVMVSAATGFGVGLVPWLVEAWVRFGGPLDRLRAAREFVGGGIRFQLGEHARLLDGPLVGPDAGGAVFTGGLWWVAALGSLGLVAAFAPGRHRRAGAAALMAGIWLWLPYLFSVRVLAPRFLLPGLGLLCVAAGLGIESLLQARRRLPLIAVAAFMVTGVLWNLSTASRVELGQVEARSQAEVLGSFIRERAGEGKCNFVSQFAYPQVELASGCDGRAFVIGDAAGPDRLEALAEEGRSVFVVSAADPMLGSGWDCQTVATPGNLTWHVCMR